MSGVDSLGFTYTLDVDKATRPAGELAKALGLVNKGLDSVTKALAKLEASAGSGRSLARAAKAAEHAAGATAKFEHGAERAARTSATSGRRIADEWERMAASADRAQQRMGRAHAAAIAEDKRRTAAMEHEAEKQVKAELRAATRIAKAREKAAEKASHKYYYGGEKSLGGLFQARHEHAVSGLVTGAADAILEAPGRLATGILSGAGQALVSGVEATASFAFNLGKAAIAAQAMREESVEGFKAIYGSAETANQLFDNARAMAKQTKFDTKDVVQIYNTLAANNFGAGELDKYSWAVADIETARKGKGTTFLNAISKIRSNATAAFGQVQSAGLQGPGIENVFSALAERKGITKSMTRKDWMALFKDGKVTREEALEAVTAAVSKKYDTNTGQLGEFAKAQGDTSWSGVLSNIKNGLGDVLNMKLPADHPMNQFKTLLKAIGSSGGLFDETSERGKKFSDLVGKFVEDVFLPFGGITLQNTGALMDRLLDLGKTVEVEFRGIMTNVKKALDDALQDPSSSALVTLTEKVTMAVASGVGRGLYRLAGDLWNPEDTTNDSPLDGGVANFFFRKGSWGARVFGGEAAPGGSHASGGEIGGGPYGSPVLTMMHVGEIVPGLHGENMQQVTREYGGGSGGNTYNIHVTAGHGAEDIANEVVRCIEMATRSPSAYATPG